MLEERKVGPKPFENSLSALAQVAVYESGARGFALFRRDAGTSSVIRVVADGANITAAEVTGEAKNVIVYPMAAEGLLAFAFEDEASLRERRAQLDRIASAIQAVWKAAQESAEYSQLASQVADLETRLMDSKIADRVRGLLTQYRDNSRAASGAVDTIERHVEGVLRPPSAKRLLQQLTRELEEEVEERRLTNRAKAILRSVHGMSEEQAHEHLRRASRKSRRKLKDIAADLIERHPLEHAAGSSH
jgi:hypothetical protein